MSRRPGLPRPRRLRGKDIAAVAVVVLFILSSAVVGSGLFIQLKLKPTDGRFGLPQYLNFPWCGRTYSVSHGGDETIVQIEGEIAPGFAPIILEPTIGKIPLLALFTSCPMYQGQFAETVIWLHVGPDAYHAYALEGGP